MATVTGGVKLNHDTIKAMEERSMCLRMCTTRLHEANRQLPWLTRPTKAMVEAVVEAPKGKMYKQKPTISAQN